MKKILKSLIITIMLIGIVSSLSINVVSAEDELPGMTHNIKNIKLNK